MRRMKILYAMIFLVACKSSEAREAANAVPCAPNADELAKQLSVANGGDPAKAEIKGKRFAFKDCKFTGQGNDVVAFGVSETGTGVDCVMAGGADAIKTFRRAAMEIEMRKLKLDVVGVVQLHEDRLKMTECKITPHE
jgi:hypothetical protein